MNRTPIIIGLIFGAGLALIISDAQNRHLAAPATSRAMLPECGGSIRELVIHYVAGDTVATPVYQQFLPALRDEVTVYVVCQDRNAFGELSRRIGRIGCQLIPVFTHHPITTWSRDRWVASIPDASGRITLLTPATELGAESWPARAGDAKVAFNLADALAGRVQARRLAIGFDAGDLLADDCNVFVTPALIHRNRHRSAESGEQLTALLQRELGGQRIVPLDNNVPPHHAGMFMAAAGDRTMLVGDPSLAAPLLEQAARNALLPDADFSAPTQAQFDAVANQLASIGYRVVRIPTVAASDARTYLTYVNVITDRRPDGTRIVYMPTYRGADALNAAAADVWRSLGYYACPIDCTSCYRHYGTLHCLVNVLSRQT